jgi:hypothetical protein
VGVDAGEGAAVLGAGVEAVVVAVEAGRVALVVTGLCTAGFFLAGLRDTWRVWWTTAAGRLARRTWPVRQARVGHRFPGGAACAAAVPDVAIRSPRAIKTLVARLLITPRNRAARADP